MALEEKKRACDVCGVVSRGKLGAIYNRYFHAVWPKTSMIVEF